MPAAVHTEGAGVEWRNLTQEALRLREAGEYDRALVIAQKALDLARQNAGEHHPDVAMSLNNLAGLYQDKGDYAKAEPLFKHSLAIYEEVLGPEHPDVAVSLDNLAELCRATSRPSEAYIFQRRAAQIRAIKR